MRAGLLSSAEEPDTFTQDIETLIIDRHKRIKMRDSAKAHIRTNHDSAINYQAVNTKLEEVVRLFSKVN